MTIQNTVEINFFLFKNVNKTGMNKTSNTRTILLLRVCKYTVCKVSFKL